MNTPSNADVGSNPKGSHTSVAVAIANHGSSPVRIIGGTTSCKCVATQDLPVEIPPGEQRQIRIQVNFSGDPGPFRQHFKLWVEGDSFQPVLGRLHGEVLEADVKSGA